MNTSSDYVRVPILDGPYPLEVFVQITPEFNERSRGRGMGQEQPDLGRVIRAISLIIHELGKGSKELASLKSAVKAQIEFGLNFGVEEGRLQLLLVQGKENPSLKVKVELTS